jgi:hypothetical protein
MMASNLSLYPLVIFFNYQQVSAYCQLAHVSCLQLLQLLRTVFVELVMGISFHIRPIMMLCYVIITCAHMMLFI